MAVTIGDFAVALRCKPGSVLKRLTVLNLSETCTRCGGSGQYSFNLTYGTTCFGCGGSGSKLPKLTPLLLKQARDRVSAGGLEAYLNQLRTIAEARRAADELMDEYAALTADETAIVDAAGGRKFWSIGTEKGFLTRHAAYPACTAASRAAMSLQYAKTDAERAKHATEFTVYREEMFAAVRDLVPANAGNELIDTMNHDSEQFRAAESRISQEAAKRLAAVKAILD